MKSLIASALLLCLLLSGCVGRSAEYSNRIYSMDTVVDLTAFGPEAKAAVAAAEAEIYRLEALWSVGYADSDISHINRDGIASVSEETAVLVSDALELYGETGGLFNIAVYPIVDAWGFYSGEHRVPDPGELETLLAVTDPAGIIVDREGFITSRMQFKDVELIGDGRHVAKEALRLAMKLKGPERINITSDAMRAAGVRSGILSLGGNVYAIGTKPDGTPWRVGVQDPSDTASLVGIISMEDEAAVTSGAYQRFFEENGVIYHHIIDPRTGRPSDSGLASVTVVMADAMRADVYSTALFIMGKEAALSFWRETGGFELVLVEASGAVTITDGLRDRFSPNTAFEVAKR